MVVATVTVVVAMVVGEVKVMMNHDDHGGDDGLAMVVKVVAMLHTYYGNLRLPMYRSVDTQGKYLRANKAPWRNCRTSCNNVAWCVENRYT